MTPKNQTRLEDADDGHQEDKQLSESNRQSVTDPDGQRHLKSTKIQDNTAADFVHEATNDMSANALPKYDNPDGTNVTMALPQGTGFVVKFDPSTAEGQMLMQIVAGTLANRLSHTNEVVATILPRVDETRATFQRTDVVAFTQDEIKLKIEKGNAEMGQRRP